MALDKDILAVAHQKPISIPGGQLDPAILSAAQPPTPSPQQITSSQPLSELGKLMGATSIQGVPQLNVVPTTSAAQQFITAARRQGVAVPAESLARLVGFKSVPLTPPDVSTMAGKLGALTGGIGSLALTSELGGEALEAPAIAKLLGSIPATAGIAKTALPILGQAGFGALTSPDARVRGAALGALGGITGKAISELVPETASIREYLLDNKFPKEIPQILSNAIKKGYANAKDISRSLYDKVQNIAEKSNFKLPYNNLYATGKAIDRAADFNIQPGTQRTLDNLADLITSPDNKIADYREIHNQIMNLGEASSKAYKPGTFPDSAVLRDVKNSLMEDVKNNALNNEQPEVANALQDANRHYRLNVAPYHNSQVFGKIIKGEIPSDQIANILTKSDSSKVLDDLSPAERNLVLYEKLKPAMQLTPKGKIDADPEKLWNSFSNIIAKNPALAERLISDEIYSRMLPIGEKLHSGLREIPVVGKIPKIAASLPGLRAISKSPMAQKAIRRTLPVLAAQLPYLLKGGIQ